MVRSTGQRVALRRRVLIYALAFPCALALDMLTPLGMSDWLIDLVLVWMASVWGSKSEARIVTVIASAALAFGLWSSPATAAPFWMGVVNRAAAILVMWAVVHVGERRRAAEEARQQAVAQIKVLQGLLPICGECKAIKDSTGVWHRLENYLLAHSEAQLTHGLCPKCFQKYNEELDRLKPRPH